MEARWPALLGDGAVNDVAIEAVHHLIKVTHEFRVRLKKMLDMKGKVRRKANFVYKENYDISLQSKTFQKPSYGIVYVAERYPEWQGLILKKLKSLYDEEKNTLPSNDEIIGHLKAEESLKKVFKKAMPFVQHIKVRIIIFHRIIKEFIILKRCESRFLWLCRIDCQKEKQVL